MGRFCQLTLIALLYCDLSNLQVHASYVYLSFIGFYFAVRPQRYYFAPGEMAERSNAAVLKTVDCQRSGGSNPSLSAEYSSQLFEKCVSR